MTTRSRRPGFTLIELLISMVIVAILASIAISLFWKAKDRGLESTLKSDLRTAAVQQEAYYERNNHYAPTPADLQTYEVSPGVLMSITHSANDGWAATAMHGSLPTTVCGLVIGTAPAGAGGPATLPGQVTCTGN
jgi:prepilin-type N-terminal cleavage/methylation domain-containing protein